MAKYDKDLHLDENDKRYEEGLQRYYNNIHHLTQNINDSENGRLRNSQIGESVNYQKMKGLEDVLGVPLGESSESFLS